MRVKRLVVSIPFFEGLLKCDPEALEHHARWKVTSNAPDDLRIRQVVRWPDDIGRETFSLIVESETFEDLPEAAMIDTAPHLNLVFTQEVRE